MCETDDSVHYDYYYNEYLLHRFISIVELVNYLSNKTINNG